MSWTSGGMLLYSPEKVYYITLSCAVLHTMLRLIKPSDAAAQPEEDVQGTEPRTASTGG